MEAQKPHAFPENEPESDSETQALSRLLKGVPRLARHYAPPLLLILLLLVAWQLLTRLLEVPKWLLPSPWQIVVAGVEARELLGPHTWQTLKETWVGLGLAVALGLGLALVIDLSSLLRRTVYPLLVASQTVPILALAPLLIIWFGYGILPKVIVVALVCFFPIVVNRRGPGLLLPHRRQHGRWAEGGRS